jgi:hypothetical protein
LDCDEPAFFQTFTDVSPVFARLFWETLAIFRGEKSLEWLFFTNKVKMASYVMNN